MGDQPGVRRIECIGMKVERGNEPMTQHDRLDGFEELVRDRRSVRAFAARRIPDDTLRRLFSVSQWAPSNCNTQPWKVAVISGARCHVLAERISAAMAAGDMAMDFPYDGSYHGVHRERQHRAAADLYSAMGIDRDDKAGRNAAFMRNFRFFDAPHAAFFFLHQDFGIREAADMGMYAQTLMLALTAHGLGSCPQTALSFHAPIVRAELGLGAEYRLLFGLSFGYPDCSHDANNCRTDRASLDQCVAFHD